MNDFMKLLASASIAAFMGLGCAAAATLVNWNGPESKTEVVESEPAHGMYFSTAYVVEEYEYDDAFCLVYNDPDANLCNVEICVDLQTYKLVLDTIAKGGEIAGTLLVNEDLTLDYVKVFSLVPDSEFVNVAELVEVKPSKN